MSKTRVLRKWGTRILVAAAVGAGLLVALLLLLLGTAPGGKLALDMIILPLLPVETEVADLSGRLWGDFDLVGIESRLPGVEARAQRMRVRWRPWALLGRRVELHRLELEGVNVRVFERPEADSATAQPSDPKAAATDSAPSPPLSGLPVRVIFDSVVVHDLAASVLDSTALTGASLRLTGSLERYAIAFDGTVSDPAVGDVELSLTGDGSLEGLRIEQLGAVALGGTIGVTGEAEWWPEVAWQLELTGSDLQPAGLMPDPEEWPGSISFGVRTAGAVHAETGLELAATVDTVSGELRGEPLAARLSGRLAGRVLDLDDLSAVWGPARVRADGSYAEAIDLGFEASVPDIGLAMPGNRGSIEARGRLSGTAKAPRVVADFLVRNVDINEGQVVVATAEGAVDLDLAEDGRLSGDVVARSLSLADEALDSLTVQLSGTRPSHVLAAYASGPATSLRVEATGDLVRRDIWRGTLGSLAVAEDSILGAWTLADPVDVMASPDSVRLAHVCLVSEPARLCGEGSYGPSGTRFTAEVRGLDMARARPFLPENIALDAVLEADADVSFPNSGPISGRVEARTSVGELTLLRDSTRLEAGEDRARRLAFAPASLLIEAGPDGITGSVDVASSDSTGAPVVVLNGELSAPPLESLDDLSGLNASGRADLQVTDLTLLPVLDFGEWTVAGGILASARLQLDDGPYVNGSIVVNTVPLTVSRLFRGRQVPFTIAPASIDLTADDTGIRATLEMAVSDSTGAEAILLAGQLDAPPLEGFDRLLDHAADLRLDLQVTELARLPVLDPAVWTVDGGILASAALGLDEARNVSGTVTLDAAPVTMSRVTRGRQVRFIIELARFDLIADDAGVRATMNVAVSEGDGPPDIVATGNVSLPGLTRIDADLEAQPLQGHVEFRSPDLAVTDGIGDLVSEAGGSFDLEADFGGTLAEVSVVGDAQLRDGRLVLPDLGLELTNMQLMATGAPDGSIAVSGEVTSGSGHLVIEGQSASAPSAETPTRIAMRGERFEIMNVPEIQLQADPDLELVFDGSSANLTGQLPISRGRFNFREVPQGAVTRSSDVIIVSDTLATPSAPVPVGIDVQVTLGDDVFFNGFGVAAGLAGDLRILRDPGGETRGVGEIRLINGTFRQLGQELRIDPGRLVFSGPVGSPSLDVRAFVRARNGTEAGLEVSGTPQQMNMVTYSRPQMSDSETMSYILFGRGLNETTGGQGNEANNAAAVLGANIVTMSLAPSIGLDEARIETGSSQDRAQFVLGKYLTPTLFVGYGVGLYQPISTFRIRYHLSSKWSIETISGDERATDLLFRIETGILNSSKDESDDSEVGAGKTGGE